MTTADDLQLLRLHVEAVWSLTLPELVPGDTTLPPASGLPPWDLFLAQVQDTEVRLWRPDVSTRMHATLLSCARRGLYDSAGAAHDDCTREVALALAATPHPPQPLPHGAARRLTKSDAPLLHGFDPEWESYPWDGSRSPVVGIFAGDLLVCVAHSARRAARACELGIDTLPASRRQGHALAATRLWTAAVVAESLIPLYSALADNAPSLALAHAAGYRPFARAAYVHRGLDIP